MIDVNALPVSLSFLSSDSRNAGVMHRMGLLPKLLFKLSDLAVTIEKVKIISGVITSLLKTDFTSQDISRYSLGHKKRTPVIQFQHADVRSVTYLGITIILNSVFFFPPVRLGLFLVYTLPPLSNTNEGENISNGDLSQDTPGTTHSHILYRTLHGSQTTQAVTPVDLDSASLLCSFEF